MHVFKAGALRQLSNHVYTCIPAVIPRKDGRLRSIGIVGFPNQAKAPKGDHILAVAFE